VALLIATTPIMQESREALLPPQLQPRWRDLPALAWTTANAFAPRAPRLVRWALAAAGAPLMHLPSLLAARSVGELASRDRHAALVVQRSGPGAPRLRRNLVSMFSAATGTTLFAAVGAEVGISAVTAAVRAGVPAGLAAPIVTVGATAPVWLGALAVATSAPAAVRGWFRERSTRPDGPYLRLSMFAAWPTGKGHGTRLADQVAEALQGTTLQVVASARTPELAKVYTRWGLAPQAENAQALVRASVSVEVEQPASSPAGGPSEPNEPVIRQPSSAAAAASAARRGFPVRVEAGLRTDPTASRTAGGTRQQQGPAVEQGR
jgi:hypothetical protein